MKININENEVYEIKLPEEIEANELFKIIEKFNNLGKLIRIPNRPKTYNRNKSNIDWYDTKEKVLDVMQYYYHGTSEDKERIVRIIGINKKDLCKRFHSLKIKFNIQPQEIGFIEFGTKENHLGIKVRDYIIKSHTGIFDENGTDD